MLKATLYIQRSRDEEDRDDVVKIYDVGAASDIYRVVYSTPETTKATQFYTSRDALSAYIVDLLSSLRYDTDPFEYVQVTTAIHPSVVYHVSDLDNPSVRHLIEDLIYSTLRIKTQKV